MAKKPNATESVVETEVQTETPVNDPAAVNAGNATETKVVKSIVPSKYAGKYKNGGSDPTALFVIGQCAKDGDNNNFEFPAFFQLCRANGIAEEQVAKYEGQVAEKTQGANGRARMTLANTLRAMARKNHELVGLDGNKHPVDQPAIAASGAVAAAQAAKAAADTVVEQTNGEQADATQTE